MYVQTWDVDGGGTAFRLFSAHVCSYEPTSSGTIDTPSGGGSVGVAAPLSNMKQYVAYYHNTSSTRPDHGKRPDWETYYDRDDTPPAPHETVDE